MNLTVKELTHDDEAQVSDFYHKPATDSMINFYLNREPGFFDALQVEGEDPAVFAVIDDETGQIAGSCIRTLRECYVNGKAEKVAYAGSMRIAPEYRGGWAFFKLMRNLKQLCEEHPCLHYCSIMQTNILTNKIFLSGRPPLPTAKRAGVYLTRIFKPFKKCYRSSVLITTAREAGLETIITFLNKEGSKKQLFPVYRKAHFENSSREWTKGLKAENIFVAFRDGEPVGTLALWDQSAFRRWMLYRSPKLRFIQPGINLYSWLRRLPAIPSNNKPVDCRYLSLICIKNDDPEIFQALFYHAMKQVIRDKSSPLLIMGHFDTDTMYHSVSFPQLELKSNIYCFTWQQDLAQFYSIDFSNTHIEIGAL